MQTKEERIIYLKNQIEKANEDYQRCTKYFVEKNMPEQEIDGMDFCGYFKYLIEFFTKKLKEEEQT